MSNLSEPRIKVIERLQKAMDSKDLDAVLAYFDPAIEYHYHVGTRPLIGIEWLTKFFRKYWADNVGSAWKIRNWAERDGKLFTEGVEEYTNAEGQSVEHPYMGIIEFNADGRIIGWRDYFQMADPTATH